jgi:hypothetical protein
MSRWTYGTSHRQPSCTFFEVVHAGADNRIVCELVIQHNDGSYEVV